jgi:hypothetical protein
MTDRVRKRARDQRGSTGRVVPTNRDRRLLRVMARFRAARTADLRRAVFPGLHRDTAGERLRKLFDAGFLEVQVADRSEENVYSLGPKGRTWLRTQGFEPGRAPTGNRSHHLAIVNVWALIAESARWVPGARLDRVRPDWELREQLPGLYPIPDLLVVLRRDERAPAIVLAVEVDFGTESVGVLRAKMEQYEAARLDPDGFLGKAEFCLAVVAPGLGRGRSQSIRSLLQRVCSGRGFVWTDSGDVSAGFTSLVQCDRTPRTDSPYGSGSAPQVTDSDANTSSAEHGGL